MANIHDVARLANVSPTALFALMENVAIGAFRALKERGLSIPQDVFLLTFDNYPWTNLVEPPIDAIEQPVAQMGEAAVNILFDAIGGSEKVVQRRLPGRLLQKGSCAPLQDPAGSLVR